MTRLAFYTAGTVAAIAAAVFFLVKMGAPGWFTITLAAALLAATLLAFWGWLLAGLVLVLGLKLAGRAAAKRR